MDAALLAGKVTPDELPAAVAGRRWPGRAREPLRAVALADGRAESPLETRGRLRIVGAGPARARAAGRDPRRRPAHRRRRRLVRGRRGRTGVRRAGQVHRPVARPLARNGCSGRRSGGRTRCGHWTSASSASSTPTWTPVAGRGGPPAAPLACPGPAAAAVHHGTRARGARPQPADLTLAVRQPPSPSTARTAATRRGEVPSRRRSARERPAERAPGRVVVGS